MLVPLITDLLLLGAVNHRMFYFQVDERAKGLCCVCLCSMAQVEGEGKAGENHGGLIGREGERDC